MADETPTADTLAAVVEAALGRPAAELSTAEAIDVADRLRALAAALDGPSAHLVEAAEHIEAAAGVT